MKGLFMPRKNTQYVGDCSLKGVAKKAYEVAKRSNAQNPAKFMIKIT